MEEEKDVVSLDAVMVEEKPKKHKNKKLGVLLVILFLILIVVFGGVAYLYKDKLFGKKNESETSSKVFASDLKITGNNLQNFDLYFMQLENPGKNMVYSPLSIKYALEMLGEGADGDTKAQIDAIVGDYVSRKYTNSANMSFANALFIRDDYKKSIYDSYKEALKNSYGAEVIYDSFTSPDTINKWVSGKTFKLIPDLLDDVNDLDYVLVNALAIDMEWVNKIQSEHNDYVVDFKHEKVEVEGEDYEEYGAYVGALDCTGYYPLKFKDVNYEVKSVEIEAVANKYDIISDLGEAKIRETVTKEYNEWLKDPENAQMEKDWGKFDLDNYIKELSSNYKHMSSSTDFKFYVDDDVKVFAKDLKTYDGTTLQYVGIMPKKEKLDAFIKNTDATKLNNYINNLKDLSLDSFEDGYINIVEGYIPMFNFEYELSLMEDLKKLGITDVFDADKSNLSKLSENKTYISTAVHKANIDFSNIGIKAAAATAMGGKGGTDGGFDYVFKVPVKRINITFDNPYMYFVRDKESGEVWFAGNVYQPSEMSEEDEGGSW